VILFWLLSCETLSLTQILQTRHRPRFLVSTKRRGVCAGERNKRSGDCITLNLLTGWCAVSLPVAVLIHCLSIDSLPVAVLIHCLSIDSLPVHWFIGCCRVDLFLIAILSYCSSFDSLLKFHHCVMMYNVTTLLYLAKSFCGTTKIQGHLCLCSSNTRHITHSVSNVGRLHIFFCCLTGVEQYHHWSHFIESWRKWSSFSNHLVNFTHCIAILTLRALTRLSLWLYEVPCAPAPPRPTQPSLPLGSVNEDQFG